MLGWQSDNHFRIFCWFSLNYSVFFSSQTIQINHKKFYLHKFKLKNSVFLLFKLEMLTEIMKKKLEFYARISSDFSFSFFLLKTTKTKQQP